MIKINITKLNKKQFDILKESLGVFNGRYALDRVFFENGKLISTNCHTLCIFPINQYVQDFSDFQEGKVYIPIFSKDSLILELVGENMGVDKFPDYKRVIPKEFNRALKVHYFKKTNSFNSFLTSTSLENTVFDANLLKYFMNYAEGEEISIFHNKGGCCLLKCREIEFLIIGIKVREFEEIELNIKEESKELKTV